MKLAINEQATGQARAKAIAKIFELDDWLKNNIKNINAGQKAHFLFGIEHIRQFMVNPDLFKPATAKDLPPGSPIGSIPLMCDF